MQWVTTEFNLPTTGFLSADHRTEKLRFNLRWFTCVSKVDNLTCWFLYMKLDH
ncbi:putative phenazine biosynthesis PhzF protein [Helianthus annuus]|nr:putative phenazine biosynthesis PhzF protein [Helianthus annuus]